MRSLSVCPPGVGGVVSSSVPGSGDGSGSEPSPGLSGARPEPQPDGEGPRRPGPSGRQTRRLLSAIRCGEWKPCHTSLHTGEGGKIML